MAVRSCPACAKVKMLKFKDQRSGLEIDSCPECFGLWFDSEELKLFFESPDLSTQMLDEGVMLERLSGEPEDPQQTRQCPECRTDLFLSRLGSTAIDYCLSCRGIWLDRRELESLVSDYQKGEPGNLLIVNQLLEGLGTPLRPNPRASDFLQALSRYNALRSRGPSIP